MHTPRLSKGEPKAKISVVFVIPTLLGAGAEGMLCRLVSGMDRKRFKVKVITLIDHGQTPIIEKIQAMGFPVRSLRMQPGIPNPMSVLRLARWLREDPPDLVSTWQYHADLVGGLAARLAGGIPLAWGIRQSNLDQKSSKRLTILTVRLCARLSRWLPKRIICCAEAARKTHVALGYAAEKMVVIHNGYDLGLLKPDPVARESVRKELGVPEGAPIIGMVARFHPQKDHRNFVEAMRLLHKESPDVYVVLCGYAVDWKNEILVRWIEEAGIQKRVYLLGVRDDIPRLTAAFDIACMSSFYGEGFPNVVSEAMSCAVPCVVTDIGEAPFIVGKTGRVVEPRNPNSLAKALLELVELGPEGRSQLGIAARQRVREHFDLPQIVKQYESLFQELACGE